MHPTCGPGTNCGVALPALRREFSYSTAFPSLALVAPSLERSLRIDLTIQVPGVRGSDFAWRVILIAPPGYPLPLIGGCFVFPHARHYFCLRTTRTTVAYQSFLASLHRVSSHQEEIIEPTSNTAWYTYCLLWFSSSCWGCSFSYPEPLPLHLHEPLIHNQSNGATVHSETASTDKKHTTINLNRGSQCKPKNPLSQDLPFSYDPANMARRASLADDVERVAALFTYSAEDVNKGVKAFIQQMDEGLEKAGHNVEPDNTNICHCRTQWNRKGIQCVNTILC